jgi:hypothetical protein
LAISQIPLRSGPCLLAALSLALSPVACGKKADGAAKDQPQAAKVEGPAPAAAEPAVPALAERDVSAEAKQWIPGFTGKLTVLVPADAEIAQSIGGFDVRGEGFGLSVAVGAYKVAEISARIEAGESPVDNARIVDRGEGFILYEGDAFGEYGFFVHSDLPPLGGLVSACTTPLAQGFPRAQAENILAACKSINVE